MKKLLQTAVLLFLTLTLVACGQPVSAAVVKSDKPRIAAPQVSNTELNALLEGNSDFALSLYKVLKTEKEGNFFYSPYSISLMMAMAYAGARGTTEQQMAAALEYNLTAEELHAAFNYLALELAKRTADKDKFNLEVVNDVWGQKDFQFLDGYLDILAQNYGAGLRTLDFITAPDESRKVINDYIYDQTNKLIEDLIPEGAINNLTRMVLTNAIYFKAEWKDKFNKNATHDGTFNLLGGGEATVKMMNQRNDYKYTLGESWQAIELPYLGDQIAMDIIMPEDFSAFENKLDSATLNQILESMKQGDIQLAMPKFKFATDFDLKNALTTLGMPVAFDPMNADFSGITTADRLFIHGVVHKAVVAVDEEGTEAAAAGAVIFGVTSMPQSMTVNRPFIFLIRDLQTGSILFLGRVLNPAQ